MLDMKSMNKEMYQNMGISKEVYQYCEEVWNSLKPRWNEIDILSEYNQLKVIGALGSLNGYKLRLLINRFPYVFKIKASVRENIYLPVADSIFFKGTL